MLNHMSAPNTSVMERSTCGREGRERGAWRGEQQAAERNGVLHYQSPVMERSTWREQWSMGG